MIKKHAICCKSGTHFRKDFTIEMPILWICRFSFHPIVAPWTSPAIFYTYHDSWASFWRYYDHLLNYSKSLLPSNGDSEWHIVCEMRSRTHAAFACRSRRPSWLDFLTRLLYRWQIYSSPCPYYIVHYQSITSFMCNYHLFYIDDR